MFCKALHAPRKTSPIHAQEPGSLQATAGSTCTALSSSACEGTCDMNARMLRLSLITAAVVVDHLFILRSILHLTSETHWLGSYYTEAACVNTARYFSKKSQTRVWISKHKKGLAWERTKNKLEFKMTQPDAYKKWKMDSFWSSNFLSPNSWSYFSPEKAQTTYLTELINNLNNTRKTLVIANLWLGLILI